MSNKKVIIILSIFLISFFSAGLRAASEGAEPTYSVSGYVTDNNNFGLNNTLVKAVHVENMVVIENTTTTDGSGHYLIAGLPNNTYNFNYTRDGFSPGYLNNVIINGADVTNPNVTLSDIEPPTITIISPTNGQVFTTLSITVNGAASDNVSVSKVEVKVGIGNWTTASGTTSWSIGVKLSEGSNTITARATDTSENIKETSITVTLDTTPPAKVVSLAADHVTETTVDMHWTTNTENDLWGYEVLRNGSHIAYTNNAYFNDSGLTSKTLYQYTVRANDTYGNWGQESDVLEVTTIDITPPASVSDPQTTTAVGSFFINNSWVNPTDADFSYVWFKYSNGTELQNVSYPTNYLNLQWPPRYTQNISAQTVDKYGNINQTLVWFNATIPNNPPVQAPIGDKEVYKGQLLTFGISTTDADSDTITYGTNATKGSLNSSTGVFTWTPEDSDAGEYIWEFNSSDGYGGVANETIRVTVKNPLEIDLKFSEPYIINDNGTWTETWRDAGVGHIGKFVGINHNFRNIGNDTLTVTKITRIYTNKSRNPQELYPVSDDNPPLPLTLAKNESKSCPDIFAKCGFRFEIDSTEVKDGFYNFTMQINVMGYNGTNFIFNYTNITMVSLPVKPIFKIKRATDKDGQDADRGVIVPSLTTIITYSLEANSSVNLTNVSIYDPFYPGKYVNISRLEANKPNSTIYTYPATTDSLSKFKCEGGDPCIINLATLTGKIESSGELFTDTEYVEICINKCSELLVLNDKGRGDDSGGSSSGGGGGGGGGGIAPSEDINNIERREVREMDVLSKTASTYVFRSADPVMVVAFESSSSENEVPVAVEVLKNRSKNIKEDAPGKPYKYFNVFVGTSGFSKKVSKGVIAYRVNNSWLKENNIDPADISLYKWRGIWVKLDTEIAENRSNYTYYASLTGNFSSFAIAAAKEQKIGDVYASVPDIPAAPVEQQNTTQAMANLSGDGPKHKIPGLSAAAILVFGIAGVIFYLKRNHKKFNSDVRK